MIAADNPPRRHAADGRSTRGWRDWPLVVRLMMRLGWVRDIGANGIWTPPSLLPGRSLMPGAKTTTRSDLMARTRTYAQPGQTNISPGTINGSGSRALVRRTPGDENRRPSGDRCAAPAPGFDGGSGATGDGHATGVGRRPDGSEPIPVGTPPAVAFGFRKLWRGVSSELSGSGVCQVAGAMKSTSPSSETPSPLRRARPFLFAFPGLGHAVRIAD
jgi:hypothetical protein